MRKCQGVPRDTSYDYANAKGEKHGYNGADATSYFWPYRPASIE